MNDRKASENSVERLIQMLDSKSDASSIDDAFSALTPEQQQEFEDAREALRWLKQVKATSGAAPPDARDADGETASLGEVQTPVSGAAQYLTSTAPELKQIGHYEVLETLGKGGFGVVVKVRDTKLGRFAALKIPKVDVLLMGEEGRQRFAREARLVAMLGHPAIVPLFETGADGQILFIASAFCNGPSLARWFADRDKKISPTLAAKIVGRLAEAIQHAHTRGVIHRDLKPGNVLLHFEHESNDSLHGERDTGCDEDALIVDALRVTDFGLAKFLSGDQGVTQTGDAIGTPAYMSPEQARGAIDQIGPAADIYALGTMLYELLTGRPPIVGESNLATMRAIESEPPTPLRQIRRNIPRDLETICLKCLDKDPARRYGSCEALSRDLFNFLANRPIEATAISRPERVWRWARRNPGVAIALLVTFASLTAGLLFSIWHMTRIDHLNTQLQSRNEQMNVARGQALTFAQRNRRLLDRYFETINDSELLELHIDAPIREQLLENVDQYIQLALSEEPQNVQLKRDRSRTLASLSTIRAKLGHVAEQEGYARQAVELMREFGKQPDADADDLLLLANAHWLLGSACGRQSRDDEALANYRQAIDLLQRVVVIDASPDNQRRLAAYQSKLAWTIYSWAGHSPLVSSEEFEELLDSALANWKAIDAMPPAHHWQNDGAMCTALLLCGLRQLGPIDHISSLNSNLPEFQQAVDQIRQSQSFAEEALRLYPNMVRFASHVAACDGILARIYSKAAQWDEADVLFASARRQLRDILSRQPNAYRTAQMLIDFEIAQLNDLYNRRLYEECVDQANQTTTLIDQWIQRAGDLEHWLLANRSRVMNRLGSAYRFLNDRSKCNEILREALKIDEQLLAMPIPPRGHRVMYAFNLAALGSNLFWEKANSPNGNPECIEPLSKAVEIFESQLEGERARLITNALFSCLRLLAIEYGKQKKYRLASEYFGRSAKYARGNNRLEIAYNRGLSALWLGAYDEIPDHLDSYAEFATNKKSVAFQQARFAALLARIVDSSLRDRPPNELAAAREILLEYALQRLKSSNNSGYFEGAGTYESLLTDSTWNVFRDDPPFRDLLESIEASIEDR